LPDELGKTRKSVSDAVGEEHNQYFKDMEAQTGNQILL